MWSVTVYVMSLIAFLKRCGHVFQDSLYVSSGILPIPWTRIGLTKVTHSVHFFTPSCQEEWRMVIAWCYPGTFHKWEHTMHLALHDFYTHCITLLVFCIGIDHFTVVGLVTWPMTTSEAGGDLVLIQTSLLFSCKCQLVSIRTTWFPPQKQWGLYQNKVTSNLAAIQRPCNWADNCKLVY